MSNMSSLDIYTASSIIHSKNVATGTSFGNGQSLIKKTKYDL